MMTKIAGGLERAFAAHGFAAPSVEDLRDAAGVSLRTLYKYAPSRDAMIRMALEHRHQRYLIQIFGAASGSSQQGVNETLDRVADWMRTEASHGCLFHAAVASAPDDPCLRKLLEQHKTEVSKMAVARAGTDINANDLLVIIEGLTQAWPLSKDAALSSAKRLAQLAEGKPNDQR
ncbi:TetR/AcrR family transcriptional regulator [Aestuariibius sp. HNIBRBA575]|uniref:TetR/AcrR family transcriptional regulator n=1 Tax=Aestuariibius sp. HNIBRBA575 TaxID=3233343 RepID=UPI0034A38F69